MRRGTLAMALLALTACEPAPNVLRPPVEYQGDSNSMVTFTTDPDRVCRGISGHQGGPILGCEFHGALVLPNPCQHAGTYAEIACHEMAHANGWRHD